MVATVGALNVNLTAETAAFQRDMGKAVRAVNSAEARMRRSVSRIEKSFGSVTAVAAQFRGALVGLGAGIVLKQIIDTSAEFQRLEAVLKTVTGSAAAADAAFAGLKTFAAETPFDLQQVVGAFAKLKALGLDPSIEALRSYGNTASAMGKQLDQFIEAVADAATGEFERLKEFGIRASSQGDQVAFTFQGVTTVVGKNAAEIEGYLRKIGQVQFAGAMDEQAKTLGGALSNLSDSFNVFLNEIGEGGFADAVAEAARHMSDAASGSDNLARSIGGALGDAVRTTTDLMVELTPLIRVFADGVSEATENIRDLKAAVDDLDPSKIAEVLFRRSGPGFLLDKLGVVDIDTGVFDKTTAVIDKIKSVRDEIEALEQSIARADSLGGPADAIAGFEKRKLESLRAELDRLLEMQRELGRGTALTGLPAPVAPPESPSSSGGGGGGGGGGSLAKQQEAARKSVQATIDALAREAEILKAPAAERERLKLVLEAENTLREANLPLLDKTRDALVANFNEVQRLKAVEEDAANIQAAWNEIVEEGKAVTESVQTAAERYGERIARLSELLDAGVISQETYNRAALDARDILGETPQAANDASQAMDDFSRVIGTAFEDAIIGGQGFMDVLAALEQDLLRIGMRVLVTKPFENFLTTALTGGGGGGGVEGDIDKMIAGNPELFGSSGGSSGGGIAGFVSRLFGFEKGGIMTADGPLPLRRYAGGGIANTPQLAMFGEGSRPEAFVPLPDGRSIPVDFRGGGDAANEDRPISVSVVLQGVTDMNSFQRSEQQLRAGAARAVRMATRDL